MNIHKYIQMDESQIIHIAWQRPANRNRSWKQVPKGQNQLDCRGFRVRPNDWALSCSHDDAHSG